MEILQCIRRLWEERRKKNIKVIAVEPEDSAVISGEKPGPHKIQGIGAGFIPGVLNIDIIDSIIKISNYEPGKFARELALKEGILAGISGGANLAASVKEAKKEENRGKIIVTILPDTGERYLSTWLFEE